MILKIDVMLIKGKILLRLELSWKLFWDLETLKLVLYLR